MCGKGSLAKSLRHAPSLSTHRSKGRHGTFISQVCSRNIHPSAPASQTWARSDDSMSFPSDKMFAGLGGRNPKPWQEPGRPSLPVPNLLPQWVETSAGAHEPARELNTLCSECILQGFPATAEGGRNGWTEMMCCRLQTFWRSYQVITGLSWEMALFIFLWRLL